MPLSFCLNFETTIALELQINSYYLDLIKDYKFEFLGDSFCNNVIIIFFFSRNEKETPIEREIRLAKEREEELKREKGLLINNNNNNNNSEPEVIKIKNKLGNKKDALQNDTRGVQHRLATNRIQQEIEEANERENELRTEGKILTTSEETVDAKVTRFTQLAESAILENRQAKEPKVMKRSSSMSQLLISMNNEEKPKENTTATTTAAAPIKTYVPQVTRRFAPNPAQKGKIFLAKRVFCQPEKNFSR